MTLETCDIFVSILRVSHNFSRHMDNFSIFDAWKTGTTRSLGNNRAAATASSAFSMK